MPPFHFSIYISWRLLGRISRRWTKDPLQFNTHRPDVTTRLDATEALRLQARVISDRLFNSRWLWSAWPDIATSHLVRCDAWSSIYSCSELVNFLCSSNTAARRRLLGYLTVTNPAGMPLMCACLRLPRYFLLSELCMLRSMELHTAWFLVTFMVQHLKIHHFVSLTYIYPCRGFRSWKWRHKLKSSMRLQAGIWLRHRWYILHILD
jgi:hypothetical protein